jgi:hypothetical protein
VYHKNGGYDTASWSENPIHERTRSDIGIGTIKLLIYKLYTSFITMEEEGE